VQIQTQKSRICCFCPDGSVMRPDAHPCREASKQFQVASVQTSWQHVRMLFRVREDSSFSLQTWIGKTACTHPDKILDKEIACKQFASIRTLGQHRPDAVLDKEITCQIARYNSCIRVSECYCLCTNFVF
jgi:hypothetical protein